jgi:poly-gamma-glutamate synthesis protein (capsule biosynthesis protein)
VNLLDDVRSPLAVQAARRDADIVVVSIHWGNEYWHKPTDHQREVAEKLFAAGADLIIGHHPHVLQPLEKGHRAGRSVAVAYSLGNFISNMDRMYQPSQPAKKGDSRDGMALLATFLLQVSADGSRHAGLEKAGYVPLWTRNNWSQQGRPREIHVLPTERLDPSDPMRTVRLSRVRSIVGDNLVPFP